MKHVGKAILAKMDTKLYNGFGGWKILKDGKVFFEAKYNQEYDDCPTLMKFELLAREDPKAEWQALLNLPLRDAYYKRERKNRWVLFKTGMGFA